ncbi:MAG: hypothetical protein KDC97_02980 [Confluentibacter sp.]|nr:hypothetical protein [Confluentibacter sp.]
MKSTLLLCWVLFIFSCGKEKVIQLPEIHHADVSTLEDVSAAYLFYDDTKTDKVDLNRKNLITTTNWLINVDKRFTLKQVIPHIQFLQEKKGNAGHKNESAKNYFTCNDVSKKNLGFIEFTHVVYHTEEAETVLEDQYSIAVMDLSDIIIFSTDEYEYKTNIKNLVKVLNKKSSQNEENKTYHLSFNAQLSFQDYITIKSELSKWDAKNVSISNHEYIFNAP